jgi:hypothetical protein
MAHFALVNELNVVKDVINVSNEDCGGGDFPESEPIGQAFIASLGLTGTWLQTSYHANFRGAYAGPGMVFVADVGEYGIFTAAPSEET